MLRTKSQQKKICSACPIAKTANLVGDSVVLIILRDLLSAPKRFKDICESLKGVSTRTITLKLKMLEEKNLITRNEYKESPPRVEYEITEKGKGLKKIVGDMEKYGTEFL